MNQFLLLTRAPAAQSWSVIADYATLAEARSDGQARAQNGRGGELAIARLQEAYTVAIAVTLTPEPI